ncbi:putative lyase [Anatilimnocola aggregata]|uniref:Putative lyase n=1 Tax=Anatilimnocola aggregata TaxID=2528021 RepID=A0A517YFB2_9BACT|nr:HEAT repeat domain-containing protein [Anatilimnocola aggregata]QDU28916.1 putative lyase [Anatilimnocola aggregata]
MTQPQPEDAGRQLHMDKLLAALGDKSWRARKRAVSELTASSSADLVRQVLTIFRDENKNLARVNSAIRVLVAIPTDVVPALIELLNSESADVRTYTALTLGERGDPRAIPPLLAVLHDPDTNVRVQAIESLGHLQAGEAVDDLVQFVESREFELAFPAIDALSKIGDGRVAYQLETLLLDPLFQGTVIDALGALGDENSLLALLPLAEEPTTPLIQLAKAITQVHDRQAERYGSAQDVVAMLQSGPLSSAWMARVESVVATGRPADIEPLVRLVGWLPAGEADASLVRWLDIPAAYEAALQALARRHSAATTLLKQRLERKGETLEPSFVKLLGKLGDRSFTPGLLRLLAATDEDIVNATLEALTHIRDLESYAPAKKLLGHPSLVVRSAAVELINSLGHDALPAELTQLLHDANPLVRESAVRVAAYCGASECLQALLVCCDDTNEHVRRTAVAHLPCLDNVRILEVLKRVVASDTPAIRAAAVGALAEVEDPQVIDLLKRSLTDTDVWVRYNAVESLTRVDTQRALADQFSSLAINDPGMQVRIAAASALGHYGRAGYSLLEQMAVHPNADLSQAALLALGEIRCPEPAQVLISALDSEDSLTRITACRSLGQSGQTWAVSPLAEAASSPEHLLSEAAICALGRLHQAESLDVLLRLASYPKHRAAVVAALTAVNSDEIQNLASHLPSLLLDVRRTLIEALVRIRTPAAVAILETAVEDAQPAVRQAAVAALSHIASGRPSPPFLVDEGVR